MREAGWGRSDDDMLRNETGIRKWGLFVVKRECKALVVVCPSRDLRPRQEGRGLEEMREGGEGVGESVERASSRLYSREEEPVTSITKPSEERIRNLATNEPREPVFKAQSYTASRVRKRGQEGQTNSVNDFYPFRHRRGKQRSAALGGEQRLTSIPQRLPHSAPSTSGFGQASITGG